MKINLLHQNIKLHHQICFDLQDIIDQDHIREENIFLNLNIKNIISTVNNQMIDKENDQTQ